MKAGKIRVVLKSRRVLVGSTTVRNTLYSQNGFPYGVEARRIELYGRIFDEPHLKAMEEGRRLARDLGVELEVVDRSELNPIKRILSSFIHDDAPHLSILLAQAARPSAHGQRLSPSTESGQRQPQEQCLETTM